MPELPEVETVVRDLRPLLAGRTIRAVRKSRKKLRRPWRTAWSGAIVGLRVEAIRRRGKWILIDLTPQQKAPLPVGEGLGRVSSPLLRVHLGMTGQFTVVAAGEAEPDHLHLALALDNETELRFRDPRRFGAAELFSDRALLDEEMNGQLGPEPFGLDADYFRAAVRGSARSLKAILLDQSIVAGVGNIYADEALFRAKLHPGRRGRSMTLAECDRLREAVEAVLKRAIESRGSSIRDYIGGSGLRGGFQNEFAVYGRTGEPCWECAVPLKCIRLAGRSTHFCPACQRVSPRRSQRTQSKSKLSNAAKKS
jgi:formamidopyrimidine-DNA glycosylase